MLPMVGSSQAYPASPEHCSIPSGSDLRINLPKQAVIEVKSSVPAYLLAKPVLSPPADGPQPPDLPTPEASILPQPRVVQSAS